MTADADFERYPAPKVCLYCDGEGNGSAGPCGFCDNGKPLDTQEDWDNSWGKVFRRIAARNDGQDTERLREAVAKMQARITHDDLLMAELAEALREASSGGYFMPEEREAWRELLSRYEAALIDGALRREQALFDAEDDDEVAAAVWVPNRTHIDR